MNRNHYFALGLVIFFLGIQIHMVKNFVLTEQATTFLAKHVQNPLVEEPQSVGVYLAASGPRPLVKHSISPPTWLGWALISIGSVLILHSLALPRPN
ncbi:MAG: hypothetical protein VXX11_00505 [Planctomycetota bacterium]|nr:hypothetical protein [Planctomycetota bacterium]